jgi:Tol biopolymer transport system component
MMMHSRFTPLFGLALALGLAWASPGFATKFSPLLADPKFRETDPVPSPDGKWLAFQSNRSGSSQIWIMSTQGGQLRQLTAEPESSQMAGSPRIATRVMTPNWAPDGKSLVYISTRSGPYSIYSIPFEGGESKPLSNAAGSQRFAVYSPDGAKICFTSSRLQPTSIYGFNLYVMDPKGEIAGPPARQVTFSGKSPGHPVWSYDGKWIAYVAKDFDTTRTVSVGGGMQTKQSAMFSQFRVFKIPAAGGREVKLTGLTVGDASEDTWPSWSPNGKQIAFGRNSGGKQSLWVVDVSTKKAFMLTDDGNCMKPTFSYDGTAIYYTKLIDGKDEDIWVANDFTVAAPARSRSTAPKSTVSKK